MSALPSPRILAVLFVSSGFTALVYQVALSRYAQLVAGGTAYAISAILVAFMLGTSSGAYLGGRWADRTPHPLRLYALAEAGIAGYAALFPLLFPVVQELYLRVIPPLGAESGWSRQAVRFTLGVAVFILPTFLMGVTTPAFSRVAAATRDNPGHWLARLYGWNTLGAALGAFTSAYVLVRFAGLAGSLLIAAALNFLVAVIAYRISPRLPTDAEAPARSDEGEPGTAEPAEPTRLTPGRDSRDLLAHLSPRHRLLLLLAAGAVLYLLRWPLAGLFRGGDTTVLIRSAAVGGLTLLLLWRGRHADPRPLLPAAILGLAFASGVLSFGLEVIWTHLLAIILGNSVYAFGLMLGSLLLGLAIGSWAARRLAEPLPLARDWLGLAFLFAGLGVVVTLGIWDDVPNVFLWLARASPSFTVLEVVRFAVAVLLMLLPTAFLGISFPLTLHLATTQGGGFGSRVGLVYAVNALGAVVGALAAPYVLLRALGSLGSLKLIGAALVVTGIVASVRLGWRPHRLSLVAAPAAAALTSFALPLAWDTRPLSTGAAIYLGESTGHYGRIVYEREDPTGGLTSVVEYQGVRTLLTNGKFQGDDGPEVPMQHRLASIATLLTPHREQALVIGVGTGVTVGALAARGFERIACAELSDPVVEAARTWFAEANGRALDSPKVDLFTEDGRSLLFESPERYDVISVQVTTIWFAGAGAIYSREFYELASRRLRDGGVLLQWFPVHHLSARNMFLVINTVRAVFPHVSVWRHGYQGFVVASNQPLEIEAGATAPGEGGVAEGLASGSPLELLGDLVVTDVDVDRFLDSMAALLRLERSVIATDSWPTLEYETPADALDNFLYFQNLAVFRRFRSELPLPFAEPPGSDVERFALAAFARGWDDPVSLPALARLFDDAGSPAPIEWLMGEITGAETASSRASRSPLQQVLPGLSPMVAELRRLEGSAGCAPLPTPFARPLHSPASLAVHVGRSLDGTEADATVDGIADPRFTAGWRARPAGRPLSLELELGRATRVAAVGLAAETLDGRVLRVVATGADAEGRWHLIGAESGESECSEARVYRPAEDVPPLRRIRIALAGESLGERLAVREVWIVPDTSDRPIGEQP